MREFEGKKLLILGANAETIPLVETARDMGAVTYVTDYNPDAPAKKAADVPCDVDGMDVDRLAELVRSEGIDGVSVGVADPLIRPYEALCERLHLPCYANARTARVFTNKRLFKETCAAYGIAGVPEYRWPQDREKIVYPAVVKPADSNSGRGIARADSETELEAAAAAAAAISPSGTVLLEKFMNCGDVSIYYTVKDGEAYLSTISDRFTLDEGRVSRVCLGDVFPSVHCGEFLRGEHPKFARMFRETGLMDGIFYVSAFYENGRFYVYDPGFRLQGGGFNYILEAACGIDHRRMLVRLALTGSMGEPDLPRKIDPMLGGKAACVLWFLLRPGTIGRIENADAARHHPDAVRVTERFREGDVVTPDMIGTERQVYMRVFLVCASAEGLRGAVRELQRTIKVLDTDGADMILPGLSL